MRPVIIRSPIIPPQLAATAAEPPETGGALEAMRIDGVTWAGVEARAISLDSSFFQQSEISACRFKKANLSDVIFENCLLFGSNFDGSGLRRVAFTRGSYSGLVMTDALMEDVSFRGLKLNLANFRTSKLKRVEFVGCDLTEADFQGAVFHSVVFKDCVMAGVEFANCAMDGVDLRGNDISQIRGVSGIRGARIKNSQLISLSHQMAAELGIAVD